MANRAVDNATSDDKVKQGDSSRGDNAESPSAAYLEGNSQARPPQKEAVNSADKILPALDKTPVLTISNAEQLKSEGGLNTADSADSADRATAQHLVGHIYASILSRRLGPTDTAPVLTISNAEQEKSEGDLNTADRATAEHLAGHIYTSIIPRRLDYAEELLPKFRTSALQHEAMPVTPYAAQEKSDRHTSEYKARQLEREAKEAKTAQRREDLESKYGALLEKPDLSKLQFTPANHEALENMVKAAELGKLSGDGQMIDFALINNTAIVNSELQALADKNPSLLNSKAVREVFKDTNVLGHTGWTQSTMETYAVGTAREDVGRAIFKYVQESHPKMASTTYEDYANKFDRYFGGGESLSIHKGEGLDSVIERAFSLSKSENKRVSFNFNGADLTVAPGSKPEDVFASYNQKFAQVLKQKELDTLLEALPEGIRQKELEFHGTKFSDRWVMHAISDIAHIVDETPQLKLDADKLINQLEAAGYSITDESLLRKDAPYAPLSSAEFARATLGQTIRYLSTEGKFGTDLGRMMIDYGRRVGDERKSERAEMVKNGFATRTRKDGSLFLEFDSANIGTREIEKAIAVAKEKKAELTIFGFPDNIRIKPDSTLSQIEEAKRELDEEHHRLADKYDSDPYNIIYDELLTGKPNPDAIVKSLPEILSDKGPEQVTKIIDWYHDFAGINWDAQITVEQRRDIARQLKDAGYIRPKTAEDLTKTPTAFARWWVGLGVEALEHGENTVGDRFDLMTAGFRDSFRERFVSPDDVPANSNPPGIMRKLFSSPEASKQSEPIEQVKSQEHLPAETENGAQESAPRAELGLEQLRVRESTNQLGTDSSLAASADIAAALNSAAATRETSIELLRQLSDVNLTREDRKSSVDFLKSPKVIGGGIAATAIISAAIAYVQSHRAARRSSVEKDLQFAP